MRIDQTDKMLVQGSTVFFLTDGPNPFNKASAFFATDARLPDGVAESVAERVAASWNATADVSTRDLQDSDTHLVVPGLPYVRLHREREKALRLVCSLADLGSVTHSESKSLLDNFMTLARDLTHELGINPVEFLREPTQGPLDKL